MCVYSIDRLSNANFCDKERRLVIALGNFDGVHLGHKEILQRTVALAEKLHSVAAVWMFVPHPSFCLTGKSLPLITSFAERKEIFSSLGIDCAVEADFKSFRAMKKDDFLLFLRDKLGVVGAVCGYNYSFGEYGSGNCDDVKAFFGENAIVLPEMQYEGMNVSSTSIRRLVSEGNTETARKILGRPFSVRGKVSEGRKIGRQMDFPTANVIIPGEKLSPAVGIYASETLVDGILYPSVTNFGINPTVTDLGEKRTETHIIGFHGDIYGKEITVYFYEKIRDERKFGSLSELAKQIKRDCAEANSLYLSRRKES